MLRKKLLKFFYNCYIIRSIFFIYLKFFKEVKEKNITTDNSEDVIYNSNIIKDVNYTTKDADGNEYIINSLQGEIDYSDSNIIYLTKVNALIKLKDSDNVTISSDYGKYNSENFDTIFQKM